MNDCTLLVNSCDKYEDAWDPFFRLLKIHWPNCPYDVVLSTESKQYCCDFLQVKTVNSDSNLSWSSRLKDTLNQIETEYILFFLEDFFLMSSVKEEILLSAMNLMQRNSKIGVISFNPDIDNDLWFTKGNYDKYFVEITRKSKYRINAVASLWRKDFLVSILKDGESPWEFEINGTKRAKFMRQKILCLDETLPKPFDFHIYIKYGYGITKQSWLPKNKELFDKYGIEVNFENLGWYEHKPKIRRKKRSFKEKIMLIFKNPKELFGMFYNKINQIIKR